ncbi:squalene/phytoene synthase family protein [Szabonella alba]|uniref:Squalene/phytoene synthase family protein n=1 Tax=Szabonella alba TaxID=2804194 RepID=A0A8K0VAR8_9RHOB|nr:squalene/phytoene synthase family protein [Szabonella alba]MBL4917541.1 squalene/phytoene synthase family protein [Szabonella alba]
MSTACAALVERADPARFAAVMAAPRGLRADLFTLYAFNLEVARAPWASAEPLVAEMRLQWWRDAAEAAGRGAPPPAHEVMGPMARLIAARCLPGDVLDALIAARRWDIYREPFEDQAAFDAYLDATGGGLIWLAALICGAGSEAEAPARAAGRAAGLAAYLQAVPELEARGRIPLVDGREAAVAGLARRGLDSLAMARKGRAALRQAAPALIPVCHAEPLLRRAARDPGRVAAGALQISEFTLRWRLLQAGIAGRW